MIKANARQQVTAREGNGEGKETRREKEREGRSDSQRD